MELQVGVKIILQNKDGKFLLMFRNNYKPNAGIFWDIPGGGMDAGFTLLENLKREVKEETGLEIIGEVKLIDAQDIFKYEDKHIVRLTYRGVTDGEIKLSEEHSKYGWFSQDEILTIEPIDSYAKESFKKII